jgi:nucleotide-binding universal stress UspA family protein
MFQKKILVPLGRSGKDLKSVHYALSLAERLQSQVYILQQAPSSSFDHQFSAWLDEALLDLINSARQAGLTVSHHITHRELKQEIVDLVIAEGIDLLVFSLDDGLSERLLLQVKPLIPTQIIQVKEKNHISYL